jgi:hypothetical protein
MSFLFFYPDHPRTYPSNLLARIRDYFLRGLRCPSLGNIDLILPKDGHRNRREKELE